MDRIDNVAVFAEVAERGSFADAARHLNRSPAAVTRAVAELEARLGVRLLNRTTRAVSVTEPGQRFLAGARRVLADLDRDRAGRDRAGQRAARRTAPHRADRVRPAACAAAGDGFPRAISRGERAACRCSTGRSIWSRRGSTPRSASARLPTPRRSRRASARCGGSPSPRPPISNGAAAPKSPRDLAAHDTIAFSGMDGIERWRFAGGVEARDQAAADRQHGGGRDRCGGFGIRHHPRAELSGRRCAGGQVARPAVARARG